MSIKGMITDMFKDEHRIYQNIYNGSWSH